ncbi:MAG: hypothetical protein HYT21_00640 [Candidatus Nealsonbacteria bacterium]|nr:hypothetical protein [Candidatus Nealsonbacteria bacterium]
MFEVVRKYIFIFAAAVFLLSNFNFVLAQENEIELHFFYSETCPHCIAEQSFLDKIEAQYPDLPVNRHPVTSSETQELLRIMTKQYGVERYVGLVPLTFIGEDFFLGFDNEKGVGRKIEASLQRQLEGLIEEKSSPEIVRLPIVGQLDMNEYSLPVLAVILGFLDGFNVCSLGALVLILALVLTFRSRRKIITLGATFIFTTALVYGALIGFWYKLFSYMAPYLRIMEVAIGIIGILGGIYFLKQFFKFYKQGPTCEIDIKNGLIAKLSNKLDHSLKQKKNIFALLVTVLFFAALITIVEFPCSAAVPVMFAGMMAEAGISSLSYFFYLAIYLLFYMLDEIIVFLIAVFNMRLWITKNKYVVWVTLAEAIILFAFGFYYLVSAF